MIKLKNKTSVKTLSQALELLKTSQITSKELTAHVLDNTASLEHLHAYTEVKDRDSLLEQAELADERYQNGTARPLEGIPISIKENLMVKGMRCAAVSKSLQDFRSPIDSTTVRRLKEAGAIITGVVNMDEYGMGSYGIYSKEGSKVKNPINENYVAGGSSAGSAVSVKSYQALASIGSDTGGSIGFPSHTCGVYGFKPSYGRVSRFGQILYSSSGDVNGPIGNSVEDVFRVFKTIQGEDENDSNCIDFNNLKMFRDKDRSRVLDDRIADDNHSLSLENVTVGVIKEFLVQEETQRSQDI